MILLLYTELILAILGASLGFSQNNNDKRLLQSIPSLPSRLSRRTSSGVIMSPTQSNIIVNSRHQLIVTVRRGIGIGKEPTNSITEGVDSAYFLWSGGYHCFFHAKYSAGPQLEELSLEEQQNLPFITPVFGTNEKPLLQLPSGQAPFMADDIYCFSPPPTPSEVEQTSRERGRHRKQQEAIVLVEYSDLRTEVLRVTLRDNNDDNAVELDTGRFNMENSLTMRESSTEYDYLVPVRRAAVISASDRDRTRCFFVIEQFIQTQSTQTIQRIPERRQAFTWQSPLFTPVGGAVTIICELVN